MSKTAVLQFAPAISSARMEPAVTREPYSFDMTQPDVAGMVLVDACIPAAMAISFLALLIAFQTKTLAELT